MALDYFGSYARRDSGPGSDSDLVAIVSASDVPFVARATTWDRRGLPVPSEILIYTMPEWRKLQAEGGRFAKTLADETVWLIGEPPG